MDTASSSNEPNDTDPIEPETNETEPSETEPPANAPPCDTPATNEPPGDVTYGAVSADLLPGCAADAHVFNFPDVDAAPVSGDAKGEYWSDGQVVDGNELSVDCAWLGAAPNRISITIGDRQSLAPRAIGMSFQAAVDEPGSGSLWLMDTERGVGYGTEQGGEQCEFTLFELDAATHSVWGQFSCSRLLPDIGDAADTCELGPSYFYMTNCDVL